MSNDEELEAFLRRFQPLPPAPLPRRRGARSPVWLIAAALLLLGVGLWLRPRLAPPGRETATPRSPVARARWGALSATALGAPTALDAELEHQAREALPDVSRRDGALRSVADFHKDL